MMMGTADDDAGREATTVEALPFVFLGAWTCIHRGGILPPSSGQCLHYSIRGVEVDDSQISRQAGSVTIENHCQ